MPSYMMKLREAIFFGDFEKLERKINKIHTCNLWEKHADFAVFCEKFLFDILELCELCIEHI